MNFDRLGKKVRPGTFGKTKAGQRENPKGPSVKKHEVRSDPISADPICSSPNAHEDAAQHRLLEGGGNSKKQKHKYH